MLPTAAAHPSLYDHEHIGSHRISFIENKEAASRPVAVNTCLELWCRAACSTQLAHFARRTALARPGTRRPPHVPCILLTLPCSRPTLTPENHTVQFRNGDHQTVVQRRIRFAGHVICMLPCRALVAAALLADRGTECGSATAGKRAAPPLPYESRSQRWHASDPNGSP